MRQFRHSGDGINGICRLLGALESFRQIDIENPSNSSEKQSLENYQPHILLPPGSLSQSGIWEAKWETREDAAQARSLFATIPFICCTWFHSTFPEPAPPKEVLEATNEVQNKKGRYSNEDFPPLTGNIGALE
jgi:hypothetical protein